MALIKCKECGHDISDKARKCPKCGCPTGQVEATQEVMIKEEPKKSKTWIGALVVALLCLIGGVGCYGYTHYLNNECDKNTIVELTPEFIKAIEKYDQLGIFSEGYAAVRKGDKWGYINTKGEEVVSTELDAKYVGHFSEGLAFVVQSSSKFSVIDTNGSVVFTSDYHSSDYYSEDNLPYYKNGIMLVYDVKKSCYIIYDIKGEIKGETKNHNEYYKETADNLYEKYSINDDNNWGLKDSKGNIVINAVYDGIDLGDGLWGGTGTLSNGVVLVILDEIKDTYDNTDGALTGNDIVRHYGYADLNGNDTFSEELKELCRRSKELAY